MKNRKASGGEDVPGYLCSYFVGHARVVVLMIGYVRDYFVCFLFTLLINVRMKQFWYIVICSNEEHVPNTCMSRACHHVRYWLCCVICEYTFACSSWNTFEGIFEMHSYIVLSKPNYGTFQSQLFKIRYADCMVYGFFELRERETQRSQRLKENIYNNCV